MNKEDQKRAAQLPDPTPMEDNITGDLATAFMARPMGWSLVCTGTAAILTFLLYVLTSTTFIVFWWLQLGAVLCSYRYGGHSPLQQFIGAAFAVVWVMIQLILVVIFEFVFFS